MTVFAATRRRLIRWSAPLALGGAIACGLGAPDAALGQSPLGIFGPPVSSYPGDPWAVAGPTEADLLGLEVVPLGAIPPIGVPYVDEATAAAMVSEVRVARARAVWDEAVTVFRRGDYLDATRLSENLVRDYPEWRRAKLLRTQSLFASGKYRAAAFALRDAIETLPEAEWGVVVAGYREFYGHSAALVDQINSLRKYIDRRPEEPEGHLLLAYHLGYLGHPQDAVNVLATLYKLQPDDEAGPMLASAFVKLGRLKTSPVAPNPAAPNQNENVEPDASVPGGLDAANPPAIAPPVPSPSPELPAPV
ncbi:MAG TPA: hypothetical protein VGE52_11420, partial [Pirellulales bacterium]